MALTDNTRGAMLMVIAMAAFTVNDAFIKSVTPFINVGQIIFVRGVMASLLLLLVVRQMKAMPPLKTLLRPVVLARCVCELLAALFYLSALGRIDFANAAAVMQSLPLAVTLGAALFLREPVGWRRWTAILVGFFGVLVILRPGPEGFTAGALLTAGAVFSTASRDLLTRRLDSAVPSIAVSLMASLTNTLFGALLVVPLGGWQPMDWTVFSHLAIAAVLVILGYQAVTLAMRIGEVSFVAPFRYTSMIWAFSIGVFVFGQSLDPWILTGTSIIIASGLYTFYRETRRNRAPIAKQATETR